MVRYILGSSHYHNYRRHKKSINLYGVLTHTILLFNHPFPLIEFDLNRRSRHYLQPFLLLLLITNGQFLKNCAQRLRLTPKFLTDYSGEEFEHQKQSTSTTTP